jgi:hypothetical protein
MASVVERRHVSQHRLEGSLADTSLATLLDTLRTKLFTGTIRIHAGRVDGTVHLRAGAVDFAACGTLTGDDAIRRLSSLRDGMYEIRQRLPDLSGALGSAASLEGEVTDVPLAAIMRHCEDNALTCTLIVVSGFERGEIVYRAGEIADVLLNGRRDLDEIVTIMAFPNARFRVVAPPLALDVLGWPAVTREPTQPFRLETERRRPSVTIPLLGGPLPLALRPTIVKRLVALLRRDRA